LAGSASSGAHPAGSASIALGRTDALLLLALGVLWGSAYVAIREGVEGGASPFLFAGVRYGIVALLFALVSAVRRDPLPSRRSLLLSATVGGTLIIGLYGMLLYWGEQYTTGGYASVLAGLAPILTVVYGHSLLPAERFRPIALVGIGTGFFGVIVLVLPSLLTGVGNDWQGPAAVLGAFVVFPLGSVLLRRWSREREGTWQLSVQFGVGAGILGLAVLLAPVPEHLPLTFAVWGSLLVLIVFASMMGYVVYFTLHHRVGPNRANLVAYIVPVVGIAVGSGLFGEPISSWELAGFALIVVGLTLVFFAPNRPAGVSAPAPGRG